MLYNGNEFGKTGFGLARFMPVIQTQCTVIITRHVVLIDVNFIWRDPLSNT